MLFAVEFLIKRKDVITADVAQYSEQHYLSSGQVVFFTALKTHTKKKANKKLRMKHHHSWTRT